MKKKFMGIALVLASALFVGNVFAASGATSCTAYSSGAYCTEDTANDGKNITIKLKDDLEADDQIVIGKAGDNVENVTIDLNGHTLSIKHANMGSHNTFIMVQKGNLTITGKGTVTTDTGFAIGFSSNDKKSVTIDKDVKVETTETTDGVDTAINVDTALNSTLNVYGSVVAHGFGINVNGQQKAIENAPVINIYDGASVVSNNGLGMYLAGYAKTTIGKATIKGTSGIGIKSGELNLNGTTVKGLLPASNEAEAYTGGINPTGAAIQIESNNDYLKPIKLNINGGNYESESNAAIQEYAAEGTDETYVTEMSIKDGNFIAGDGESVFDVSEAFTAKNTKFISGGHFIGKLGDDFAKFVKAGLVIGEDGTVAAPAPAEEAKDDVPETNDVFQMALVGIVALGVAGTYAYKKLNA